MSEIEEVAQDNSLPPPPINEEPKVITYPKSFGFVFNGKLFNGTVIQYIENKKIDIHVIYDEKEYFSMAQFYENSSLPDEEREMLNLKVNQFANLRN